MLMFPLSAKLRTGVQSVLVQKQKTRIEDMTFHISKAGRLRDSVTPPTWHLKGCRARVSPFVIVTRTL